MIRFKKWQVVTAAVLGVLVIWGGWSLWKRGQIPIKTAEAEIGSITATINATGRVEAKTIPLGAKSAGRIVRITVQEGDRVAAGETILKLDTFEQANRDFLRNKALYDEGLIARKVYEDAKLAFDATYVAAPQPGFVSQISVEIGQVVAPGAPVITLVDTRDRWIEIQIDEADIGQVQIGQPVEITASAYPGATFPGRVESVIRQARLKEVAGRIKLDEDDLIFKSRVSFDDPEQKLIPGLSVETSIVLGVTADVLTIPRSALALKGDSTVVYVVTGRAVRQKNVEIGARDMTNVEVRSGIAAGDRLAVSNLDKLKDRSRIRIER